MSQYWIFVFMPFSDFNRGSFDEIIKKTQLTGRWALGATTICRKQIKSGDEVLIYGAGEGLRYFIADATLLSGCLTDTELGYYTLVGNLELWKKPLYVKGVLKKLSFIKNRKHWGLYFKGGIIPLPKEDYHYLMSQKISLNVN